MKYRGRIGIALIVNIFVSAIIAQAANAQQQPLSDYRPTVSENRTIFAAAVKKKKLSVRRSICDAFAAPGWTCYPAGFRACCCYSSSRQDCFSLE